MEQIYVASPVVALLTSVVLQILKRARWSPLSTDTARLNATVSGAAAFLSSLGLAFSFDFDPETGKFAAGFTGSLDQIVHVLLHFPLQWAEQHGFYKLILVPELLGEIRTLLKERPRG